MLGTHVRHHMTCRVSYEEEDTCSAHMSGITCHVVCHMGRRIHARHTCEASHAMSCVI